MEYLTGVVVVVVVVVPAILVAVVADALVATPAVAVADTPSYRDGGDYMPQEVVVQDGKETTLVTTIGVQPQRQVADRRPARACPFPRRWLKRFVVEERREVVPPQRDDDVVVVEQQQRDSATNVAWSSLPSLELRRGLRYVVAATWKQLRDAAEAEEAEPVPFPWLHTVSLLLRDDE